MERFSLDLLRAVKKDMPWKCSVGACGICGHRRKLFLFCNLNLGQAIRNLACGDGDCFS